MAISRDIIEVDVHFVGAGPANLAGALHLLQLVADHQKKLFAGGKGPDLGGLKVMVTDKGKSIGAHGISGAILDPAALKELFTDFETSADDLPRVPVRDDSLRYLTTGGQIRFPFIPPPMNNHGMYVISLGELVKWLGRKVEAAGAYVFAGFPAAELLCEEERVVGIRQRDHGIDHQGGRRENYQPGADVRARVTILGEGPRGSLTRQLVNRFHLDGLNPQVYAVGVKELWLVPGSSELAGRVIHTLGYPLPSETYGGGFIYYMGDDLVAVGLVTGLDYRDPFTDPHMLFSRFKLHPLVKKIIEKGKIQGYGAKTIPEGGYYSLTRLGVEGCLVVGDSAGYMNPQRLKGIHLAMKSGMLAAQAVFEALLSADPVIDPLARYQELVDRSWIRDELYYTRNVHQGFEHGLWSGLFNAGLQMVSGGRGWKDPWKVGPGHERMQKVERRHPVRPASPPDRIEFDHRLTFNKDNSVYHSGTIHEENQPAHLHIDDLDICHGRCREEYGNPCQYFCPAGVYEFISPAEGAAPRLHLNFTNCVHCKTCDVSDPYGIITWTPAEGGGGPDYKLM